MTRQCLSLNRFGTHGLAVCLAFAGLALADGSAPVTDIEVAVPIQNRWGEPDSPPPAATATTEALTAWRRIIENATVNDAKAAREFLQAAVRQPAFYLSEDHEATSQRIAVGLLKKLVAGGQAQKAGSYCLQLRWIAPRVDLLAPDCRDILHGLSSVAMPPTDASPIERIPLLANPALAASVRTYLANPFDPEALANLITDLDQQGHSGLAERLLPELYELDPECLWNWHQPGLYPRLVDIARRRR